MYYQYILFYLCVTMLGSVFIVCNNWNHRQKVVVYHCNQLIM